MRSEIRNAGMSNTDTGNRLEESGGIGLPHFLSPILQRCGVVFDEKEAPLRLPSRHLRMNSIFAVEVSLVKIYLLGCNCSVFSKWV